MRWDIERYVKVYRRDTAEWLAVSWQARGLFYELLRKADRDGCIAVGRLEPEHAVAILVHGTRADVAGPLRELLDDGCLADIAAAGRHSRHLLVRNYREAQDLPESGAERQAKHRAKLKEELPQVTERDERNAERNSVTPSDPNQPNQPNPTTLVVEAAASDDAGPFERVAAVWSEACVPVGFARAHNTPHQRKAARTRMREPGWFDAFRGACEYVAREPFYRGASASGWVVTLGWLLKPGNSEKTAERGTTRPANVAGELSRAQANRGIKPAERHWWDDLSPEQRRDLGIERSRLAPELDGAPINVTHEEGKQPRAEVVQLLERFKAMAEGRAA